MGLTVGITYSRVLELPRCVAKTAQNVARLAGNPQTQRKAAKLAKNALGVDLGRCKANDRRALQCKVYREVVTNILQRHVQPVADNEVKIMFDDDAALNVRMIDGSGADSCGFVSLEDMAEHIEDTSEDTDAGVKESDVCCFDGTCDAGGGNKDNKDADAEPQGEVVVTGEGEVPEGDANELRFDVHIKLCDMVCSFVHRADSHHISITGEKETKRLNNLAKRVDPETSDVANMGDYYIDDVWKR